MTTQQIKLYNSQRHIDHYKVKSSQSTTLADKDYFAYLINKELEYQREVK